MTESTPFLFMENIMTEDAAKTEAIALNAYVKQTVDDWLENKLNIPLEKNFCTMRGYPSNRLKELRGYGVFAEAFDMMKDVQENLITIGALQGKFKSDFALRALEELSGWRRQEVSPVQANIQINNVDMKKLEMVMKKIGEMNARLMGNRNIGEVTAIE